MAPRRLAVGGGELAREVRAEGEHLVLGQPRRAVARGAAQMVLEGLLLHARWRGLYGGAGAAPRDGLVERTRAKAELPRRTRGVERSVGRPRRRPRGGGEGRLDQVLAQAEDARHAQPQLVAADALGSAEVEEAGARRRDQALQSGGDRLGVGGRAELIGEQRQPP